MRYSRKVGPPIVSAAVATLVLTNFALVSIVKDNAAPERIELFGSVWPIALTSAVAVILVMSFLYRSLVDLVDELEAREATAQHQALHDQLTGLANRALLEDRLSQALTRYRRSGEQVALLMLDLDRFKQVNDTLGHNAGDKLVAEVGERLRSLVRETDTVARIGGDEFAIVQVSPKGEADVRRLCERIISVIRQPFVIGEREARVGVSIGAVFASKEVAEASELMRKADITMYRAKAAGRDCFRIFTEAMDADVQRRDQIESSLRTQLRDGDGLDLHFQPIIGSRGKVTALEGLVRWEHPTLGTIAPGELIPIAEECGVIDELGQQAFRNACKTARLWPSLSIAVNTGRRAFLRCCGRSSRRRESSPRRSSSRSPRASSSSTAPCAGRRSRTFAATASGSSSTISAPAIPRSPSCADSRSTRSSSTARSSTSPRATRASPSSGRR